jgi:hypothetical protein
MASNITTSASFGTSNMKPSPGEQADAIWAQNMADDVGYVYFREAQLTDLSPTAAAEARYVFTKKPSHNGIKSLTRGLAGGAVTEYIRVFAEGADPTVLNAYSAVGTSAYTRAAQTTRRFDIDISALTDGNVYIITMARDTGVSAVRPAVSLVYGSNASY